jgi:hypothetical protein
MWETLTSDCGLAVVSTVVSIVAVLLGVAGIWRAEHLFKN